MEEIKWNNVEEKLPPHGSRCLCYCFQGMFDNVRWRGVIDCTFSHNKGFQRTETNLRDVYVTHWIPFSEHLFPKKD